MDPNINFGELRSRVTSWTIEDELKLLNKLKAFSDDYNKQADELNKNIQSFSNNLNLINVDYFSAINTLRTLSLKKFFEHVVDHSEIRKSEDAPLQQPFLSIDEAKNKLDNKIRSTIGKSIEAMSNPLNNNRNENESNFDDGASESSLKLPKAFDRINKNFKLPYIIGTTLFNNSDTCGILDTTEDLQKKMNMNNNQIPDMQEGKEYVLIKQPNPYASKDPESEPKVPSVPNVPQQVPSIPVPPQTISTVPTNSQVPSIPTVPISVPSVPLPQASKNIVEVAMSKISSSAGVPLPPPMNFPIKPQEPKPEKKEEEKPKKILQCQQPKPQVEDFQTMLKRMVMNRDKGAKADIGSGTVTEKQADPNVPANKNDIKLNQFVNAGMFKDEEDEDDKDDIDVGIYNNKTKAKPKENAKEAVVEEEPSKPGNLFDMKSGNTTSLLNKKKSEENQNLKNAKSKFEKMFGNDDDNEEETKGSNKIEKKTNDLSQKLNLITSKPITSPIITNTTTASIIKSQMGSEDDESKRKKGSMFIDDSEKEKETKSQFKSSFEEMKRKLEERNTASNPSSIKLQKEVKVEPQSSSSSSNANTQPPVCDFKDKMSGIANMMEGRIGGGIGFGKPPENNEGRQEAKNSNEKEENTSLEEIMEKQVVVQKKKPKRKGFDETDSRTSKVSNSTAKTTNDNIPITTTSNNSKPPINFNPNGLKDDMRSSTKTNIPQQQTKRFQFLFDEE